MNFLLNEPLFESGSSVAVESSDESSSDSLSFVLLRKDENTKNQRSSFHKIGEGDVREGLAILPALFHHLGTADLSSREIAYETNRVLNTCRDEGRAKREPM
jgi:hypothetical protein